VIAPRGVEVPGVNEPLCRALLRARLTEEDLAAELQVDPKTVRRWLEGRVPYPRHRWALAFLLGVDEADLWPQLRAHRSLPGEIRAIYPRLDRVPREVWLSLFGSAWYELDVLAFGGLSHADDPEVMGLVAARARLGARVRVCLVDLDDLEGGAPGAGQRSGEVVHQLRGALASGLPLPEGGGVLIRVYQGTLYQSIYRADGQLLVAQHVYGVPPARAPVLHLQRAEAGDLAAAYLESFERVWVKARPVP
jgi:transcriptional regulator with XRE-family HTH domain